MNQEKSRVVSVFAIQSFKYLTFTLGKNGKGIYIRVYGKSWKKMKSKLKELSSRRFCQSIQPALEKIEIYMCGWLNYYGIADMNNKIDVQNKWLIIESVCVSGRMEETQDKDKNSNEDRSI